MNSTLVKVKCKSKKESINYDPKRPKSFAIEFEVPYDQNSIFYQMSGGTAPTLNTVNEEAANMFVIGQDYDITITPSAPNLDGAPM